MQCDLGVCICSYVEGRVGAEGRSGLSMQLAFKPSQNTCCKAVQEMIAVMLNFCYCKRPVKCHFKLKAHSLLYWGRSETGGEGIWLNPQNSKMTHCNMLTWPQNAGNPISGDLNFRNIPERRMLLDTPTGDFLRRFVS